MTPFLNGFQRWLKLHSVLRVFASSKLLLHPNVSRSPIPPSYWWNFYYTQTKSISNEPLYARREWNSSTKLYLTRNSELTSLLAGKQVKCFGIFWRDSKIAFNCLANLLFPMFSQLLSENKLRRFQIPSNCAHPLAAAPLLNYVETISSENNFSYNILIANVQLTD